MDLFLIVLQWFLMASGLAVWICALMLVIYYHYCKPRWETKGPASRAKI